MVSLYKDKGEALDRGKYQGLKLAGPILKVIELMIEDLIPNIVKIDNMQFGFMPGHSTLVIVIASVFFVMQIPEAYIRKNRSLYFAFVDLEKTFGRVPRKVL